MTMATVTIDVDLPPGVTITAYHRHGDGQDDTRPQAERLPRFRNGLLAGHTA